MKAMTIKQCRELYGISKEEMARATGISTSTISKWEQGEQSPTVKQTCKLLNFFNSKGFSIYVDDIDFDLKKQTA
jgi:transcriptional regulator with XRE-family HTH domain